MARGAARPHEAAQLAQRPVLAVQVVAAVVVLAALVTGIRNLAPDAGPGWPARPARATGSLAAIEPLTLALVAAVGLWLVLGPIAVYMVVRADRQGGR